MIQKLIIVGAGSVGKFIAYNITDFNQKFEIVGFLDDDKEKQNKFIAGYPVLGEVDLLQEYSGKGFAVVLGIAFPKIKKVLFEKFKFLEFDYPNFISKNAWLSNDVNIGKGCILYPGVSINYETRIDDFAVINMNCAIGHNCVLEDYVSLSPGVNLGGCTVLREGVDMGIGSVTKQFIEIGEKTIIGAGAVVLKSKPANSTAVGNPANVIKSH